MIKEFLQSFIKSAKGSLATAIKYKPSDWQGDYAISIHAQNAKLMLDVTAHDYNDFMTLATEVTQFAEMLTIPDGKVAEISVTLRRGLTSTDLCAILNT